MDGLLAEIARKRKQIQQPNLPQEPSASNAGDSTAPTEISRDEKRPRFVKRAELERQREAEYFAKEEARKRKRELHANVPEGTLSGASSSSLSESPSTQNKAEQNITENRSPGSNKGKESESPEPHRDALIGEEEMKRRFRLRGEPIRLFGESKEQRWQRLKWLESRQEQLGDESQGQRNIYRDQAARVDSELQREDLAAAGGEGNASGASSHLLEQRSVKDQILDRYAGELDLISTDYLERERNKCHTLVYVFWKRLLRDWERKLDARADSVKRSTKGKAEAVMLAQTTDNLKPFFQMLKKRQVASDVLDKVTEMCHWVHRREYVKANDAFLRLAIGNAPWPIGVTQVGIHERSARERIQSNQVGHVLNDGIRQVLEWLCLSNNSVFGRGTAEMGASAEAVDDICADSLSR